MANPLIHAKSSTKRFGGKAEDYLPIHILLDSPKTTMNNNTSRMLTHNIWFCYEIIPKIFGYNIVNSDGKSVDTVDIAMLHVAEDNKMRFIPTVQDYLQHLQIQPWMNNGIKSVDNPISEQYAIDLLERLRQKDKLQEVEQ
jgi:hypothetical protein